MVHPITVLTIRQQTGITSSSTQSQPSKSPSPRTPSLVSNFLQTYRDIGVRGLYRGCLPIAMMGIPSSLVYFGAYEGSREVLVESLASKQLSSSLESTMQQRASMEFFIASGCSMFSNCLSLLFYVPAEVVASRMIIQGKDGLGMTSIMRRVLGEGGARGFYRGYSSSLLTGVVSSSAWWWSYALSRQELYGVLKNKRPQYLDGTCGLLAGITSMCVSHPLDTLKTRIMTGVVKERSLIMLFHRLLITGTVSSLWKGFAPNLYQSAITSTAFALVYESIKRASS